MSKQKMIAIIQWIFGIIFIIAGLGSFSASIPYAAATLLFGISLLPVIWKFLRKKKIAVNRWLRIAVSAILLILCMANVPSTYATNSTQDGRADAVSETEELAAPEAVSGDEAQSVEMSAPTAETEVTETPAPEPSEKDMTVHFLDVGQGLSIFVQSGGENLIYDGGDRDTSSFVVAYLKEQGVATIDYLISSHYDADHVSGLIGCLNAFTVENVICSDYEHDSKTYESFIDAVDSRGLVRQHPAVGEEFSFGTGKFIILAPETVDADDSNDNSVVIKLVNGENSFIFTGDAESGSEAAMCRSGIDLDCDVLVPSHHGSATGTSWDFLQATVPEFAVISCGQDNQYGHPHKDTMDKLEAMDIQVFRTDLQGTIVVESDGENLKWNQEPCNDYSSGDQGDAGTEPQTAAAASEAAEKAAEKAADKEAAEPAAKSPLKSPAKSAAEATAEPTVEVTATPEPSPEPTAEIQQPEQGEMVWLSETGSKYHNKPNCGNMNPDKAYQVTKEQAQSRGYDACKNCYR